MFKKIIITALFSSVLYSGETKAMENPVNGEKVDRIAEIIKTMGFEKGSQKAIERLPDVLAQSNIQASDEEIAAAWNKIEAMNKPKIESGLPMEEEKRLIQNRMLMEEAMKQHFGEDMAKHGSKDTRDVIAEKEIDVAKQFIFTCPTAKQVQDAFDVRARQSGSINTVQIFVTPQNNADISFYITTEVNNFEYMNAGGGPLLYRAVSMNEKVICEYRGNSGIEVTILALLNNKDLSGSQCQAVDEKFRTNYGAKEYASSNPEDIKIICER